MGATPRLRTLPDPTATIAATYGDIADAAAASVALTAARVQPVLAELLDAATLRAIGFRDGAGALLIVQTDGGPDEAARATEVLGPVTPRMRWAYPGRRRG